MSPPTADNVALVILAAGASSRMQGRDKLLENVANKPLLAHVADVAIATGNPVFVTLPVGAQQRHQLMSGKPVKVIDVRDAESGMSESFNAWANSAFSADCDVMILLADMPDITTADLLNLLDTFADHHGNMVVRATGADGTPGHPVIFPRRLIQGFARLRDDQGARAILTDENIITCPLPDAHATTDLDTPEQWETWRRHNS